MFKKGLFLDYSENRKKTRISPSFLLVNVYVSIDCFTILWNLTDCDFSESTVIHILYDDIISFYIDNDTNVSIITIISSSS